jgi:hypothetical protein
MKVRSFVALAVLTASPNAFAQAVGVATTGPAPAVGFGNSDGFAAPNGQLGAGLSISKPEGARAFGELGFYTVGDSDSDSAGGFTIESSSRIWSISAIIGGGYKIAPDLELLALLPLSFFSFNFSSSIDGPGTEFDDEESESFSEVGVGNLQIGVNYVRAEEPVRMIIGGAVQYGPWTIDPEGEFAFALGTGYYARSGHDIGLWAPETLSLVTPSHVEFGDQFVVTGDGGLGLHVPTDGGDVELSVQLDPGFGYYVNPTVLVGARLPFVWFPTESGSGATFVALEPYGRFDVSETAFVNARFTLNLDEPLGFSFDDGKIWALHFGGGGTF